MIMLLTFESLKKFIIIFSVCCIKQSISVKLQVKYLPGYIERACPYCLEAPWTIAEWKQISRGFEENGTSHIF